VDDFDWSPDRGAHDIHDAYETWSPEAELRASAPVVLSCEHATQLMPAGYRWHPDDAHLRGTHWAYDLGVRDLTLELALHVGAPAVLSRFSRLIVDPNRSLDSDTLFRTHAEGRPIRMNADLAEEERQTRLNRFYHPYHRAFSRMVEETASAPVVFAVHSFTPLYEGDPRSMEVAVLFDKADGLAHRLGADMEEAGLKVAYNAPYSGKAGMMHAVERHAMEFGREAVELEVRQDLVVDRGFRETLVPILARLFPR